MKPKTDKTDKSPVGNEKARSRRAEDIALEVGEGAIGAIAGAAIGSLAGPPGAIAGAILGAAAGAIAGRTGSQDDHRREDETTILDEEIGVTKGEIGDENLEHPPTKSQEFAAKEEERHSSRPPSPNKKTG